MLYGLVGCGGFGREVMPLFERLVSVDRAKGELVFVESEPSQEFVHGRRVVSIAEFVSHGEEKRFNVAIADGYVRKDVAEKLVSGGAIPMSIAAASAEMYSRNSVGEGAVLCANSIVTSDAKIGRFFHSNLYSYVAHDCIVGDYVTFAPRVCCNGNVVIEDFAYIGTGAVIRQGSKDRPIRIGRGAIVGMGAVVTRDVPAGETWVGNPARPLKREP